MRNIAILGSFLIGTLSFSATEPKAVIGKGLYEQAGANSCLYCHGAGGLGGSVKTAAKLSEPKTWKVYALLGGDAEFNKDKAAFLKKMEEKTVSLIINGAIKHNASVRADLTAKGVKPYDAQMMGLSGAPSVAWLNKYKDKGIDKEVAAKSVYLHLQSFDKQGVFPK